MYLLFLPLYISFLPLLFSLFLTLFLFYLLFLSHSLQVAFSIYNSIQCRSFNQCTTARCTLFRFLAVISEKISYKIFPSLNRLFTWKTFRIHLLSLEWRLKIMAISITWMWWTWEFLKGNGHGNKEKVITMTIPWM